MADANALAVLPDGGGVKVGEAVEIMMLDAVVMHDEVAVLAPGSGG
jgi:hypothetical protein